MIKCLILNTILLVFFVNYAFSTPIRGHLEVINENPDEYGSVRHKMNSENTMIKRNPTGTELINESGPVTRPSFFELSLHFWIKGST